jgi:two-component system, cell cycle sensor histidine kinase and response regulator CckA
MPRMGGRELWQRLQVARPESQVLYISGYPGDAMAHQNPCEHGGDFLPKPFAPATLALKVREILDRR